MAAQVLPIPLPLKGLNTIEPFIDPESGYARQLTNYNLIDGVLAVRSSMAKYFNNIASLRHPNWLDPSIATAIRTSNGDIYNLSTNAVSANIGGACIYHATTVKHSSLSLVCGCREPRLQANPFTAWTFTTIAPLTANGVGVTCACSHNGRLYVAEGQAINYSSVGQITGAMPFSLSFGDFLEGQDIWRMFSVTTVPGNNAESVFVIFGSGGMVLIYRGTFPGSTTWELVGKYLMPEPISNDAFLEIDGDIFIASIKYCYWFRDLFESGVRGAYENRVTFPIENSYLFYNLSTSAGQNLASVTMHPHVSYLTELDAILVYCGFAVEGSQKYFIYHRKYKAWTTWLGLIGYNPTFAYAFSTASKQTIRAGDNGTVYYGGAVNSDYNTVTDAASATFAGFWRIPYINQFSGTLQKLTAVRSIMADPLVPSGTTNVTLSAAIDYADFGNDGALDSNPRATQSVVDAKHTNAYFPVVVPLSITGETFSVLVTQSVQQRTISLTALVENGGPL